MTFTQYLHHLVAMRLAPSFWALLDHRVWPGDSTRLEDFEEFLRNHLQADWESAVLELRPLWSRWAEGPASSADLHADHAIVAWRGYALNLRDGALGDGGPCPRAGARRARAIQESHFHDLATAPADPVPCEDPDEAEARYRTEVLADQVLGLPSVEEFFRRRRRASQRHPSFHPKQ